MSTLAILRSSAEQVALSWDKPEPSTCRGLAMTDMLRSGLHTLENVAIALKNPHGDRMPRALRGGVVRCSGCGKRNGALSVLQNQLTFRKHVSCRPKKEKERKGERKKRENDPAAQTGW